MQRNLYLFFAGITGFLCLFILTCCTRIELPDSSKIQTGIASWYGKPFHGEMTSNQEIFNMYELTAAHPTLKFNTMVMVTNLENGKSVIVRINDRGPFVKDRVIDLSYAAAKLLGMINPGVASVRLEILDEHISFDDQISFSLQVGAFISKKNAQDLKKQLEKKYQNVFITTYKTRNEIYYRVRIKAISQKEAERLAHQLIKDGFTVLITEH
jgi:rare lipoprotein A